MLYCAQSDAPVWRAFLRQIARSFRVADFCAVLLRLKRMSETTASVPFDADQATALRDRLNSVRQRVAASEKKSGQRAGSVVLIVVSKSGSIEQIREMVNMGQIDFGENRVQQLSQRAATIGEWISRRKEMDPRPRFLKCAGTWWVRCSATRLKNAWRPRA